VTGAASQNLISIFFSMSLATLFRYARQNALHGAKIGGLETGALCDVCGAQLRLEAGLIGFLLDVVDVFIAA
jgi:hypothetical protein